VSEKKAKKTSPPVCDYEGSDYQKRFWEKGGREYEDLCEAVAMKRLLPKSGKLLLELGAGAGRNTLRYKGFDRIVLLDYSRTQLKQAQDRLGTSSRFVYVAADIYHLPFRDGLFDCATMIRTLHHMADAPEALHQVRNVLRSEAGFVLEFANKRNIKSMVRYALHRQGWNPFTREPVEFAPLNFDFHPRSVRRWLKDNEFAIRKVLTVSHFRVEALKRSISPKILAGFDSMLQWTGALFQVTPSVFLLAKAVGERNQLAGIPASIIDFFKCPQCGNSSLAEKRGNLQCPSCKKTWKIVDGIYDFRGEK
jgi:ubiquinone/menaquinone biosynthesis C-methylase UbiE